VGHFLQIPSLEPTGNNASSGQLAKALYIVLLYHSGMLFNTFEASMISTESAI